jgi:hypothetical protein
MGVATMKIPTTTQTVFLLQLVMILLCYFARLAHSAARPATPNLYTKNMNNLIVFCKYIFKYPFPEVGVPRGDLRSSTTKCNVMQNTIGSTCDLIVLKSRTAFGTQVAKPWIHGDNPSQLEAEHRIRSFWVVEDRCRATRSLFPHS